MPQLFSPLCCQAGYVSALWKNNPAVLIVCLNNKLSQIQKKKTNKKQKKSRSLKFLQNVDLRDNMTRKCTSTRLKIKKKKEVAVFFRQSSLTDEKPIRRSGHKGGQTFFKVRRNSVSKLAKDLNKTFESIDQHGTVLVTQRRYPGPTRKDAVGAGDNKTRSPEQWTRGRWSNELSSWFP